MRLLAGALALCATFQGATAQCADLDASGQVGVEVRELLRILLSLWESPSEQWGGVLSWLVLSVAIV